MMFSPRFLVGLLLGLTAALGAAGCGPGDGGLGSAGHALRPARLDRQGRPILPIWATAEERELQARTPPPPPDEPRAAPVPGYRVPAEYDPVQAVVMTYTSYEFLLAEIAPHVASAGAEVWMVGGPSSMSGVPASQYRQLGWPHDSVWARDYGPFGIDEDSHALGIVDTTYRHYASRPDDDDIPCRVAQEAGAACHTTTLILDGGNYMTDGLGTVFLTRRVYDWNSQLSVAQVDQLLHDYLGAETLHVLDYAADGYGEPVDGTGHIDMFAKLLPGCVVLVAETDDAPFAATCDAAAATFASLECQPGQGYQVLRVPGWYEDDGWWGVWYTYTNSLIVNDTVLVPSYAGGPNSTAQSVYQQALPGYNVVLINTDDPILSGGSIHCVTMQVPLVEDTGCDTAADCDLPNVDVHTCVAGVCGVQSCDPGYGDCDGEADDGCETSLWQPTACGATCGRQVNCLTQVLHATSVVCAGGLCDYAACDGGFGDCDGDRTDGCETDLGQVSACGTSCVGRVDCGQQVANASGIACAGGQCDYAACATLFGDCDGDRTNGCELDLRADESHCGDCLRVCTAGQTCEAGVCRDGTCPAGYADCDQSAANGCEVELGTDTDCSGCGDDCRDDFAHAQGTCERGTCAMGACDGGFADCDQGAANGCEVALGTDTDCSGCGDDCTAVFPHGQGACVASACALQACEAGYADCDLDPATGCERWLGEDSSCGSCTRACAASESCVRAGQTWVCAPGCADADGDGAADQACGGSDCNDRAPGVNPDAAERCNLADDDCDGQTDEDGVCERPDDGGGGCGCAARSAGSPGAGLGLLLALVLAIRRGRHV